MTGVTGARAAIAAALTTMVLCGSTAAQPADQFYKNKQMRLIIGHAPGGDYDIAARLLADHMVKHIPGQPRIVIQNMQGASSIIATNYLAKAAPRDGTVFASLGRNIPLNAVTGTDNLEADPRQLGWIGGLGEFKHVCVVTGASPIKTVEDIFQQETIVGSSGAGFSLSILPTVLNRVLNTKFRVIEGYAGSPQVLLAMERGEVQGICRSFGPFKTTHAEDVRTGKMRVLFYFQESPFTDMPNLPSIFAFANEDQKQYLRVAFSNGDFGRPYVTPPQIPADRLATLRQALGATARDAEFQAAAEKMKLDVTYLAPDDLIKVMNGLFAIPKDRMAEIKAVLPESRD